MKHQQSQVQVLIAAAGPVPDPPLLPDRRAQYLLPFLFSVDTSPWPRYIPEDMQVAIDNPDYHTLPYKYITNPRWGWAVVSLSFHCSQLITTVPNGISSGLGPLHLLYP